MSILLQEYANVKRSQRSRGFGSNNFYKNMMLITEAFLDIEKSRRNMLIYDFSLLEDRRRGVITEEEATGNEEGMWAKIVAFFSKIWKWITGLFSKSGNQATEAVVDGVAKFEQNAQNEAKKYNCGVEEFHYELGRLLPRNIASHDLKGFTNILTEKISYIKVVIDKADIVTKILGEINSGADTNKMAGQIKNSVDQLRQAIVNSDDRNKNGDGTNAQAHRTKNADLANSIDDANEFGAAQYNSSGKNTPNTPNGRTNDLQHKGAAYANAGTYVSYSEIKQVFIPHILPLSKEISNIDSTVKKIDETIEALVGKLSQRFRTNATPGSTKTKEKLDWMGNYTSKTTTTPAKVAPGAEATDGAKISAVTDKDANRMVDNLRVTVNQAIELLEKFASTNLKYFIQDMFECGNNLGKVIPERSSNSINSNNHGKNSAAVPMGDSNVNASYYDYNRYGFYGN